MAYNLFSKEGVTPRTENRATGHGNSLILWKKNIYLVKKNKFASVKICNAVTGNGICSASELL